MASMTERVMRYEQGEDMSQEELTGFFQALIDTGLAWKLQWHYGTNAKIMIDEGICKPAKEEDIQNGL